VLAKRKREMYGLSVSCRKAQMVFVALSCFQLSRKFNIRIDHRNLWWLYCLYHPRGSRSSGSFFLATLFPYYSIEKTVMRYTNPEDSFFCSLAWSKPLRTTLSENYKTSLFIYMNIRNIFTFS
jgi:hypothetical protein